MRAVILAGGRGTRLAEETEVRPKPMVEIGGRPILWHILKLFSHHGVNDFFIALGYRGEFIKQFFRDYNSLSGNMTVNLARGTVEEIDRRPEDWIVNLIDTGPDTTTGSRVKRLEPHLRDGTFMVTYGDGVSDVDIKSLLAFHRSHGKIATLTAVRPMARFGAIQFAGNNSDLVANFTEKPQVGEGWINGGFLVFEPGVFDYLEHSRSSLEADALQRLAADGELAAYRHNGFWQCMDTLREKNMLEGYWQSGEAPWRVWDE